MTDTDGHPWERTFVENMARARKAHGLSQSELARRAADRGLAFHQQTVQRIEQGIRPVRLNEAVVLSDVLLMDDLVAAITPHSLETVQAAFEANVSDSRVRLVELARDIWRIQQVAATQSQELFSERAFFVQTALNLGEDLETTRTTASEANRLLNQWQSVRAMLQVAFERAADEEFDGPVEEVSLRLPFNPDQGAEDALRAVNTPAKKADTDGEHPEEA